MWARSKTSLARSRRGAHATSHHLRAPAEKVLVVAVQRPAVGDDEPGLSLATRTAAALRIVGRRGRHVAQVHEIQIGDVHPELHGGRAHEIGKPAAELGFFAAIVVVPAEAALALLSLTKPYHLGRVLAGLEGREARGLCAM